MIPSAKSFADTPSANRPRTSIFIVFGFCCARHCVAKTCSTSDVPMPKANAPNAPCVLGVAIAADDRHPRLRQSKLWADYMDNPLIRRVHVEQPHTKFFAVGLQCGNLFSGNKIGDGSSARP